LDEATAKGVMLREDHHDESVTGVG
jgi:hypothetical protein